MARLEATIKTNTSEQLVGAIIACVEQELRYFELQRETSEEMRELRKDAERYRHLRQNQKVSVEGTEDGYICTKELDDLVNYLINEYKFNQSLMVLKSL